MKPKKSPLLVNDEFIDGTCMVRIGSEEFSCTVKDSNVDTTKTGTYYITYSYTYLEREYTYKRYVFVLAILEAYRLYIPYRKEDGEEL